MNKSILIGIIFFVSLLVVGIVHGACTVPVENLTLATSNSYTTLCNNQTWSMNGNGATGAINITKFGTTNITLDCNGTTITGKNLTTSYFVKPKNVAGFVMMNCNISNFTYGYYALQNSLTEFDYVLKNSEFSNNYNGEYVAGITRWTGYNNTFHNSINSHCIYFDVSTGIAGYLNDTKFYNNNLYDCASSAVQVNSGNKGRAFNIEIYNNTVTNSGYIKGGPAINLLALSNGSIHDNIITNNYYGMVLGYNTVGDGKNFSSKDSRIYNNQLINNSNYEYSIMNFTTNNSIYDNTYIINRTDGIIKVYSDINNSFSIEENSTYKVYYYETSKTCSFNYTGVKDFNKNYVSDETINMTFNNQQSKYPFNDLRSVSTGTILSSNFDNYSMSLSTGQSIEVGFFLTDTNYYVSPLGSDSNVGNISSPFLTLEYALSVLQAGENIYLREGNYTDPDGYTISNLQSNTDTVISGYNNELVEVSTRIDSLYNSSDWNNQSATIANLWNITYSTSATVLSVMIGDTNETMFIHDTYSKVVDSTMPVGCYFNTTPNVLWCRFNTGMNPDNTRFYISKSAIFTLSNNTNIRIENLTFKGGTKAIAMTSSTLLSVNTTIQNNKFYGTMGGTSAGSSGTGIIDLRNSGYINVLNNYIEQNRHGVWDWTNTKASPLEASAIRTENCLTNINISNNTIREIFNGIYIYATATGKHTNIDIGYNSISDIYDDGIELENYGTGAKVHHNTVNDTYSALSIIPYNSTAGRTIIEYNILGGNKYIYENYPADYTYGNAIKVSGTGTADTLNITHNTLLGRGIYAGSSQTHIFRNVNIVDNIFYQPTAFRIIDKSGLEYDNVLYNYNLYYRSDGGAIFRYWSNDTSATEYTTLASALASGRTTTWDLHSIQDNPDLNTTGIPFWYSPVCGAASDGTDIGALPCYTDEVLVLTSPVEASIVDRWLNVTWETPNHATDYANITINGTHLSGLLKSNYNYTIVDTNHDSGSTIVTNVNNSFDKNSATNSTITCTETTGLCTTGYVGKIFAGDRYVNKVTINATIEVFNKNHQTYLYLQTYDGVDWTTETMLTSVYPTTRATTTATYDGIYELNETVQGIRLYMSMSSGWYEDDAYAKTFIRDLEYGTREVINIDTFDYNLPLGEYRINLTEYNMTDGIVASSLSGTFNITKNAILNLTVRSYSGSSVNFTANLSGEVKTGYDSVEYYVANGGNYDLNITVTSSNPYNTAINITTFGTTNETVSVTANNSVNISIYNAVTGTLITENISIIVTSGRALTYYTTSGSLLITDIQTGFNEFKVSNENYSESRYQINVIEFTTQNFTAYLLPIGGTDNVTYIFYDYNGIEVEGIYIGEYLLTNNSYVLLSSSYSDIAGKTYFTYDPDYQYMYNYSGTGYVSSSFVLNPPREDSYDITLASIIFSDIYATVNVNGSYTWNNATGILTFSYVSGDSTISNYSYTISKIINSIPTVLCSGSKITTTGSWECNLDGYTGQIYLQGVADNKIFYGRYIDIGGTDNLGEQLDEKDAGLWGGMIGLIIVMATIPFGIFGVIIGGIISLLTIYWLQLLTAINMIFVVVAIIGSMIIALGIRRT